MGGCLTEGWQGNRRGRGRWTKGEVVEEREDTRTCYRAGETVAYHVVWATQTLNRVAHVLTIQDYVNCLLLVYDR